MASDIRIRDLVKVYGRQPVVRGIDLDIPAGSFAVFVGPSGCGKTTTLRMIAGLESISYGELSVDGVRMNDTPSRDRGVAMVFQSYALYPHKTVRENLEFSLQLEKLPKAMYFYSTSHYPTSTPSCVTRCALKLNACNGSLV